MCTLSVSPLPSGLLFDVELMLSNSLDLREGEVGSSFCMEGREEGSVVDGSVGAIGMGDGVANVCNALCSVE